MQCLHTLQCMHGTRSLCTNDEGKEHWCFKVSAGSAAEIPNYFHTSRALTAPAKSRLVVAYFLAFIALPGMLCFFQQLLPYILEDFTQVVAT